MNTRKRIIDAVINKGGLYGRIALLVIDEETEDKFIVECFDQCHNKAARRLWGKKLVVAIIRYRLDLIRIPLKKVLLQQRTLKVPCRANSELRKKR